MSEHKLTRRQFLKDAAIAGTAVAAGSLLPQPSASAAAEIPTQWDKETDVVVVGTGCGLAAAIEAKTAGSDVIIIEKADHVGGLFITAGGSATMGGNNVVQQREGVKDDNEQWFQDEMYANGYRGSPEIMRALVEKGADTVKWFQDLGMVWGPLANGVLRPGVKRGISPAASPNYVGPGSVASGIAWTQVMKKKVDALGIPILLKTKMTRIFRDGTGPVVGIEAKTETGTLQIKARKAVILATGSWTDNPHMCQAWDPRISGPDSYGDGEGFIESTGDGQILAQDVGAGLSDMSYVAYLYIFFGGSTYWTWEPPDWTQPNEQRGKGLPLSGDGVKRVILVKNDGARYINEDERNRTIPAGRGAYSENPELPWTDTYLSLPQPRNVWVVTDADGVDALKWGDLIKNANPKKDVCLRPDLMATADTIEALASKMGIDPAKLAATVTKYNGFVDAGKDADFGKAMPFFKIAKPPFFAAKATLKRHTQRNGLRVNSKSQVLEQSDQLTNIKAVSVDQEDVIPHFYAAGEVGDNLGFRRVHNSLAHYITTARIAGENAAKETGLPAI